MKKNFTLLIAAVLFCFANLKAQNNNLSSLKAQNKLEFKNQKSFSMQNNLYAFAGSNEIQPIQNLTMAPAAKGIGGLTIAGMIVLGVGVGLLIGGISMVKNADGQTTYVNENGQEAGSLSGATGALLAVGGGVLTLGGTAMTIIGLATHKKRR